jgi:hypothetical protein
VVFTLSSLAEDKQGQLASDSEQRISLRNSGSIFVVNEPQG